MSLTLVNITDLCLIFEDPDRTDTLELCAHVDGERGTGHSFNTHYPMEQNVEAFKRVRFHMAQARLRGVPFRVIVRPG